MCGEVGEKIETPLTKFKTPSSLKSPIAVFNPFGPLVGEVKKLITCTYEEQNGELYAASKAVCFRSTAIFGFEIRREIIPWSLVQNILVVNEEGVNIATSDGRCFEFRRFKISVDYCVQLFKTLWKNECIVSCPNNQHVDPIELLCQILSFEGGLGSKETTKDRDKLIPSTEISNIAMALCHPMKVQQETQKSGYWGEIEDDCGDEGGVRGWKECLNSKEPLFSEKPVANLLLDCSMDNFFDRCLADDAEYSFMSFHSKEMGDYNVSSTSWETQDHDLCSERTITYTHPVQQRMAPPTAEVLKTQILRKFGTQGMCIITKTVTKGVPVSNCFYVEDCLLVGSRPGGGVSISIAFDVRFVKSTMLRKIVENTTKQDVINFHKEFEKFLKKKFALIDDSVVNKDSKEVTQTDTISKLKTFLNSGGKTLNSNIVIFLLLLMQIYTSFLLCHCR